MLEELEELQPRQEMALEGQVEAELEQMALAVLLQLVVVEAQEEQEKLELLMATLALTQVD